MCSERDGRARRRKGIFKFEPAILNSLVTFCIRRSWELNSSIHSSHVFQLDENSDVITCIFRHRKLIRHRNINASSKTYRWYTKSAMLTTHPTWKISHTGIFNMWSPFKRNYLMEIITMFGRINFATVASSMGSSMRVQMAHRPVITLTMK